MTDFERKQHDYDAYLEQPETNGLRYGSPKMYGTVALENKLRFFLMNDDEPPGSGIFAKTSKRLIINFISVLNMPHSGPNQLKKAMKSLHLKRIKL